MSERPTPKEIVDERWERSTVLDDLAAHGYVIAHPDDVPEMTGSVTTHGQAMEGGWNGCRARIFGGGK